MLTRLQLRSAALALLLCALLPLQARAAGSVDASSVAAGESGVAASSLTLAAYFAPSDVGPNSALVVCLSMLGLDATFSVSSISWNSRSFTQAVFDQVAGGQSASALWYLTAPDAGITDDLVVTYSEGLTGSVANAYVIKGVKPQAPEAFGSNKVTNSATISASATTVTTDAFLVDCLEHNQSSASNTPDPSESGQVAVPGTQGQHSTLPLYARTSSRQGPTTPGSTAMSWSDLDSSSSAAVLTIAVFESAPLTAVKDPLGLGVIPAPR